MHRPHRANLSEVPSVSRPSRVERCYLNLICWKSPFPVRDMRKAHYLLNSYLCKKINFAKDIWAHPRSRGLHLRERAPVFFIIYRWPCPQLRPSVLRGLAHTQHSTLPRGHENPTLPPFQPFISPPSSPVYFRRACPYYLTAPDVLAGSRRLTFSRLDDDSDSMRSHILAYNIQFLWIKLFYSWDSNSSQYFYI